MVGHFFCTQTWRLESRTAIILASGCLVSAIAIYSEFIKLPDLPFFGSKSVWSCGIAVVMCFVVLNTKLVIRNKKVADFLHQYGTISYSTYLYHNLFVAISVLLIINFQIYDTWIRLMLTFFFTLFSSYAAAILSYNYVEKPSMNLGRYLVNLNKERVISAVLASPTTKP